MPLAAQTKTHSCKPPPIVCLLIANLLLLVTAAFAQDADWSRLHSAGNAAMAKHQYSEAESFYREALNIAEKHWKRDARISTSLIRLAESCNAQSKKDDAESLAHRSVASFEEAVKAHKPKNASDELQQAEISAALLDKSGDIFTTNHNYADAETAYQNVIATREKFASETKPAKPGNEDFFRFLAQASTSAQMKIAEADDKLANLYRSEHKFTEAETLYRESEVIREKQYGSDHFETALSLNNLATCYSQDRKYELAEPLYKRVVLILEHSRYKEEPPMATVLENYALLLKRTAREAGAKDMFARASEIRARAANIPH